MSEPVVTVEIAKAVEKGVRALDIDGDPVIDRSYGEWELDLSKSDPNDFALPDDESTDELTDAGRLHLDVVTHRTEVETELGSRGTMNFDVPIDIAVRQKLGQAEQDSASGRINVEEVDRLMGVSQRVLLAFAQLDERRLKDLPYAVWQTCKMVVAPHPQNLRELRQFTAIVRLVFRMPLSCTGGQA